MIRLPDNIHPAQNILDGLKKFQDEIDGLETFEVRSAKAKALFPNRNKKGNKIFDAVKVKLTDMCSGARRCVYCEDSMGDEVEHIYPKDIYPGKCFQWDNYVYACGICNGPKNNKFAVFQKSDGKFVTVNPQKGQPAAEPPEGDAALINPRTEDPMNYFMLDLKGTFLFVILAPKGTDDYQKADYTLNEVLRLNEQRELLRQARKNAYGMFKARLYEYTGQKQKSADQAKLDKMIEGIKTEAHPTVWREMQRYHKKGILAGFDPDLDKLFVVSPEALGW